MAEFGFKMAQFEPKMAKFVLVMVKLEPQMSESTAKWPTLGLKGPSLDP